MKKVIVPPHQDSNDKNWDQKGDWAGYFPTSESAQSYADEITDSAYHKDRLRALHALIHAEGSPDYSKSTILDFGIGDCGQFAKLDLHPKKVIGVDISQHMLDIAKDSCSFEFEGYCGSSDVLKDVPNNCADLTLCINTLGYLSGEDQKLFFLEAARIVKPGGFLLIMTGNELFDLFALNSGTSKFFESYFNQPKASDVLLDGKLERFKNADRRNPLNFCHELKKYGFKETAQSFSQWHCKLPSVANREFDGDLRKARAASRDHDFDPNSQPDINKWKSFFQCSMFASMSQKI